MGSEKNILTRAAFVTGFFVVAVIITVLLVQMFNTEKSTPDRQATGVMERQAPEQITAEGSTAEAAASEAGTIETSTGETLALVEKSKVAVPTQAELADRAFIHEVFPLISAWDLDAVQPYFSEATLSASERYEGYQEILNVLSERLGELYNYDEPRRIYEKPQVVATDEEMKLKEYAFRAYYAMGNADVSMTLAKPAGPPSLHAFQFVVN